MGFICLMSPILFFFLVELDCLARTLSELINSEIDHGKAGHPCPKAVAYRGKHKRRKISTILS
jgi:hypothetical protein